MSNPRVVSLIASSTEIVCALGLGHLLVGRSHECDFPEWVERLPQCTETKFRTDVPSREIDREVKRIVSEALSVYRVHPDLLRSLKPDVILTQIQCVVCAVSQKDVEAATCEWMGAPPILVSLETNCLADLWRDIHRVAEALGAPQKGEALISQLKTAMETIARQSAALRPRPTVACIEWIDPLMAAGNWMPELIAMAGGRNLFGQAGKHSPGMALDELIAKDPDIIFISPCGFDIPRTQAELPALTHQPEWKNLRAVREGRVYLADGNQFFNRPGPRLLESLQILAEICHPDHFNFGHRDRNWTPLGPS